MAVSILPKPSFDSFTDPITFENLTDPWLHIGCSKDFNKSTIIEFVQKTRRCPWCQAEVKIEDFIPNRSLKNGIEEMRRRAVSQVSSICSTPVPQNAQMNAPKEAAQPPKKSQQGRIHYLDSPKFMALVASRGGVRAISI